jgi:predicted choloylglycine hydrolase
MAETYPIQMIDLAGSPYKLGTDMSRSLTKDSSRLGKFQRFVAQENTQVKSLPIYAEQALNKVFTLLKQRSPGITEWVEGMTSKLGIPAKELFLFSIGGYFSDMAHVFDQRRDGCSTFSVSHSDQGPILAKNRDSKSAYGPWQVVIRVRPQKGFGYLAMTTYGIPGVNSSGMNEHGLAVADTHVTSSDIGPGLPRFALIEKILSQCTRVDEALGMIMKEPLMGRGNLVLADAQGALGVAELGNCRRAVRSCTSGYLINTNHFTDSLLQSAFLETNPVSLKGTSEARYSRLSELLSTGNHTLAEAKQIMAYHGGALDSLCRHEELELPHRTISTVFYLPQQRKMIFFGGYPCMAQYQELVWQ